jgi:hypothetical protein
VNELWSLWFPRAGATGISFGRCRVDGEVAGDRLLVHAAPPVFDVDVHDDDGNLLARGRGLTRGAKGPMTYLLRAGSVIALEDGWPRQEDLGRVVLLPGGEAAILTAWWHADDHSEWRWSVEFSNHV